MQIDNNNLIPIIEKVATDIATRIVQQALTQDQYSVPTVASHFHNGSDSPVLDINNIQNLSLPAGVGGVAAQSQLGGDRFVSGIYPGKVITGSGSFTAGDAPLGTVMFFMRNNDPLRQMWIRADVTGSTHKWFGIDMPNTA